MIAFHYPPELLALLIDAIPLLCRSYEDTLLFFKGAGVSDSMTRELWHTVKYDRQNINKYQIARTLLTRLNEGGDSTLQQRREVLIREAFTLTGPEGEGIVEQVDGVVELSGHLCFVEMKWWKTA